MIGATGPQGPHGQSFFISLKKDIYPTFESKRKRAIEWINSLPFNQETKEILISQVRAKLNEGLLPSNSTIEATADCEDVFFDFF